MVKFICVLPDPSQWFFHFGKEIVIAWTRIGWVQWMFQNLPLPVVQEVHDSSSSGVTPCIFMKNDGVLYHQVLFFSLSTDKGGAAVMCISRQHFSLPWKYSVVQYFPINIVCHNKHHLHCILCRARFLWTRRTRILPCVDWHLKFGSYDEPRFFPHSEDSSKKVVTFSLVLDQQSNGDRLHFNNELWIINWNLKFDMYPTCFKFAVTQNVKHSFVTTPTSAANSHAVHLQSTSNRVARSWSVMFSTWGRWGRSVWRLSWVASLPSQNTLTHCATVQYGNAVSSHASCSPWKHSCLLQPHATSILIEEYYSSFVNMVLGRSHYPCESQRSTHCSWLKECCRRRLH